MIDAGAPKPAAIIATPVGFVGAAESKAELAANPRGIPFLTVRGRRGGSAIAAAALNAIALGHRHDPWLDIIGVRGGRDLCRAFRRRCEVDRQRPRQRASSSACSRQSAPRSSGRRRDAASRNGAIARPRRHDRAGRRRCAARPPSSSPAAIPCGSASARRFAGTSRPTSSASTPHASSFQYAAARMRWPLQHVTTLSLHARPVEMLHPHLAPGNRILALTTDAHHGATTSPTC